MTPVPRSPDPQSPSTSSHTKVPEEPDAAVVSARLMTQQPREGSSAAEKVAGSVPLPPNAQLLDQIRREYLDMPGLKLTLPQAQRLWYLRERECEALLGALIDAKFLWRSCDGRFARVSERGGINRHRRMAKTQLEPRAYRATREAAR